MSIVESKGAFHKSKLAGRTMAEHIILTMKNALSKHFVEKPSPSCIPFKIWLIWLKSYNKWISHHDGNGLAGQFWQMESALYSFVALELKTDHFVIVLWPQLPLREVIPVDSRLPVGSTMLGRFWKARQIAKPDTFSVGVNDLCMSHPREKNITTETIYTFQDNSLAETYGGLMRNRARRGVVSWSYSEVSKRVTKGFSGRKYNFLKLRKYR